MPRETYTSEFKEQRVALVRAGRSPESLARVRALRPHPPRLDALRALLAGLGRTRSRPTRSGDVATEQAGRLPTPRAA